MSTKNIQKYLDSVQDHTVNGNDDQVVPEYDISFSLDDIAFGEDDELDLGEEYPLEDDDEIVDTEDAFQSPYDNRDPDLVAHDAKYHKNGYDPSKSKCKYREQRNALVFGKTGEARASILASLKPEEVDGEEIDKADEVPQDARRQEGGVTLGAKERELKELERQIKSLRASISQAKKSGKRERVDQLLERRKEMNDKRNALRTELGKTVRNRFPSKSKVLLSEESFSLTTKLMTINQKLKRFPSDPIEITRRGLMEQYSNLCRDQRNLKEQIREQNRKDAEKLDADERRGIIERRTYYIQGRPIEVRWHDGKWHVTRISEKDLNDRRNRARKTRADMIARLGEKGVHDLWNKQTQKYRDKLMSRRIGLDKEEGQHLFAQFRETIPEGEQFSLKKFREWLAKYRVQQAKERAAARAKIASENSGGVGTGPVGAGGALQGNALANRLKAFLAANPDAVKAPADNGGEYPHENAMQEDKKQSNIDFARSIAEQMKRAARGA